MPDFDAKVLRLAAALEVPPVVALGLRGMLLDFAVDFARSRDVTDVSYSSWALALGCERDEVQSIIDAFVEAGFLDRRASRLLVSDWDAVKADESAAAFRGWLRSNPGGVARLASRLKERGG